MYLLFLLCVFHNLFCKLNYLLNLLFLFCRYLPSITMLELIISKIMELIFTRLQIANKWKGVLTPDVLGRISSLNRVSRHA